MRKTPGTPTTPFSLSARKQQMEWPVIPVLKGVLREALAPLTNNAWDVIKTWFTSGTALA